MENRSLLFSASWNDMSVSKLWQNGWTIPSKSTGSESYEAIIKTANSLTCCLSETTEPYRFHCQKLEYKITEYRAQYILYANS